MDGLTTIDLFAGAGGITEGFRQAGFRCLYANDFNPWAMKTFQANHPDTLAQAGRIEEIDARKVRKILGLDKGELSVLVGGPPCQGFSVIAPERFLDDPRNSLFKQYIRFVDEFKPVSFFFENVPGMLSLSMGKVFTTICSEMEKRGYNIRAKILFAPHYGVPQERWRLIILGTSLPEAIEHPYPEFWAEGRPNFTGGKNMIFRPMPLEKHRMKKPPTVGDAISDLPRLEIGSGCEIVKYNGRIASEYAKMLRNPEGETYNHFAPRIAQINIERMKHIKPGGSWRDLPPSLLPRGMTRARRSDHTKRYGRLRNDGLSATILTKCDPHWSPVFLPDQDRTLTVREAARLQSFPDYYRFYGPRVSQYEQVGNAVPVLMAKAIALAIKEQLGSYGYEKAAMECL